MESWECPLSSHWIKFILANAAAHYYAEYGTSYSCKSRFTWIKFGKQTFPPVYTWRHGLLIVTAQTTSPWFRVLICLACRGIPGPINASGGNGTGCICPSALTWNEYALIAKKNSKISTPLLLALGLLTAKFWESGNMINWQQQMSGTCLHCCLTGPPFYH